ncbi:hypothetical protein [Herpetosiphon geysericola]|uniref:Uncharacterized protein n=1 Tax=Herpetosiphon geysericola TaxID=70996 RepID=A0A0N8GP59_9CHLR|nr:hypothetical protein [Herpetosiphon geysericola]KPL79986.1 hypothetical protein SE18_25715 [Herpetosiphon geysericola]
MSQATQQISTQAPRQAIGSSFDTSAPTDTAAVLEDISFLQVGYRRDRPPVRDYWSYLPIKLRNTAPTPLHLGVYLLFARQWGLRYSSIHITDQAICAFTAFPWNKASRGKVHRAKQWLIKKGWLYCDRLGSCRRPRYTPTWGVDTTGKPLPWMYRPQERHALSQPRGRGYEAIKVPVEMIDDLIGVIDIDTGVVERYWAVPLIDLVDLGHYVRQKATPTLINLGVITKEGAYLPVPSREVLLQKALRGELTHVIENNMHTPVKFSNSGLGALQQYFPRLQSELRFVVTSPLFTSEDQERYKEIIAIQVAELERDTQTAGRVDLTLQMAEVAAISDHNQTLSPSAPVETGQATDYDKAHCSSTKIDPLIGELIDPLIGELIDPLIGSAKDEGSDQDYVDNELIRPLEREEYSVPVETKSGSWSIESHEPNQSDRPDPSMDTSAKAPKRKRKGKPIVFEKRNQGSNYQEALQLLNKKGVKFLAKKIARAVSIDIINKCITEAERQQASGYEINDFGAWVASLIRDTQSIGFAAACARRQPRKSADNDGAAHNLNTFDIRKYELGGKYAAFFGEREVVVPKPTMLPDERSINTEENSALQGTISSEDLTNSLRIMLQQAAPIASIAGDLWIDPEAWAETGDIRLCCASAAAYCEVSKYHTLIRSCVESLPGISGKVFLSWGFAKDLESAISAAELWARVSILAQEMVNGADKDLIRQTRFISKQDRIVHIGALTISVKSKLEDRLIPVFRNAFAELGIIVNIRVLMINR